MITFGFFNAVYDGETYDREYTADQLSAYLEGIVGNGVFPNPSTSLQVMASSTPDMNVTIKEGKGWIDGYWLKADADFPVSISSASATLHRIDRIVLRWDFEQRTMSIVVKEGTPSSTPEAPDVERTSLIKEYSLATILISANQTVITQANITDTRSNNEVCGWVTSLIEQIDTTTLFNQYQAAQRYFIEKQQTDFDKWFDDVQTTLSSATILRRYSNSVETVEGQAEYQIGIVPFNSTIDTLNVLMNGVRLRPETDYTFDNVSVVLKNIPEVRGQSLDFEVFRNVNGADAATLIGDVEKLQGQMAKELKYKYYATGTGDNIAINTIVENFYNGTNQFAGISANSQLKLEVIGELGLTEVNSNGKVLFNWSKPEGSGKRLFIDFSNCVQIVHSSTSDIIALNIGDTYVENLYLKVTSTTGSAYGSSGRGNTFDNCIIEVYGNVNAVGIKGYGRIDNSFIRTYAKTGFSYGISLIAGITRVTNGLVASFKNTSNSSANICGIYSNIADAILTATNVSFPKEDTTGYSQVNSIKLTAGKYSLLGNIIELEKSLTGATGTETGSIDLV